MTTTTTLPELDVEMIFKLIKWAEQDEKFLQQFRGWGTWNQGIWGGVPQRQAEQILGVDDLDYRTLTAEEQQEIRNGACETAYCMAGQTVAQHNYRLIYDGGEEVRWHGESMEALTATSCIKQEQVGTRTLPNGREVPVMRDMPGAGPEPISYTARTLLGLTDFEQDRFFSGSNGLEDLRELANGMCHRRGLPLLFPNEPVYNFGAGND